jgi:hypothetical protein
MVTHRSLTDDSEANPGGAVTRRDNDRKQLVKSLSWRAISGTPAAANNAPLISREATMSLLQKTDDLPMSRLRQSDAEKVVLFRKEDLPMSRLRQLHAEKIVLLPLLAGVIVSIIYLVGALNR